jgi:tRNA (uracil-5-)-methyltransferase TRM9
VRISSDIQFSHGRPENYTHYNDQVDAAVVAKLLELNREFYWNRGLEFSATRGRLQPGVQRLLEKLRGGEYVLDLGCGNGELARRLSSLSWSGFYLGLDFSPILLAEAKRQLSASEFRFASADLSRQDWDVVLDGVKPELPGSSEAVARHGATSFDAVLCFAVMHHLPGCLLRTSLLRKIRERLAPHGTLMLSNWQFMQSPRLSLRVQPWSGVDLSPADVDANDYLLDWRRGGKALRYVHEFDEVELEALAAACGFVIRETFYSDGADRRSGMYQVWQSASADSESSGG